MCVHAHARTHTCGSQRLTCPWTIPLALNCGLLCLSCWEMLVWVSYVRNSSSIKLLQKWPFFVCFWSTEKKRGKERPRPLEPGPEVSFRTSAAHGSRVWFEAAAVPSRWWRGVQGGTEPHLDNVLNSVFLFFHLPFALQNLPNSYLWRFYSCGLSVGRDRVPSSLGSWNSIEGVNSWQREACTVYLDLFHYFAMGEWVEQGQANLHRPRNFMYIHIRTWICYVWVRSHMECLFLLIYNKSQQMWV